MKQINPSAPKPLQIFSVIAIVLVSCTCLQAQSYIDAAKAAEVDKGRVEHARALMAAHQLDTAATELESVRAGTKEATLRNATSIMLMSVYLEEGNYTRAEALLDEGFQANPRNEECLRNYFALAGQAINGARSHLARYRSFGINITDVNLQTEAANDLNRLRGLIERMSVQAKTIAAERKAYDSLSLLEDVIGLRLSLATDAEDQAKWSTEYSGVRELLASSQTQVASLGAMPVLSERSTRNSSSSATNAKSDPIAAPAKESNHVVESSPASLQTEQPASRPNASSTPTAAENAKPVDKGPLNLIAARRVLPHYPNVARQMGMAGMVRVYVVIDEKGRVVDVPKSDGPAVLRTAAEAAARQWMFAPSVSDGRPVRATGYIDFNFTL